MITNFVVFDADGRIARTGTCPDSMVDLQAGAGEQVMQGTANESKQYVLNGELVDRPENTAKLSGQTLANVPAPSVISINGTDYPCDDSSVDLDFTYPGEYRIAVHAFPYTDVEFKITV